ncbi:unnamed protein product [Urochloa humidicola]
MAFTKPSTAALLLAAVLVAAMVAAPAAGAGYINYPVVPNRPACPPNGTCAPPGASYTGRGCQRIYHDPGTPSGKDLCCCVYGTTIIIRSAVGQTLDIDRRYDSFP